jgi:hypothetical protein
MSTILNASNPPYVKQNMKSENKLIVKHITIIDFQYFKTITASNLVFSIFRIMTVVL